MDYTNMLDRFGMMIEDELKDILAQEIKDALDYHPFMEGSFQVLQDFLLRSGRRLASSSTLIVYQGYKCRIDPDITKAACGIELYRHSILAHDDIVDAEMLRRGGKTLQRIWAEGFDDRFGAGCAIFAGNILYSLAINTILRSGFDGRLLMQVTDILSSDFKDINESQMLDLLFEYREPTREEWAVMAGKRAASLFRTALTTGAILASAPEKDIPLLHNAAKHIGFSFDIQDDIIDTFADREEYGREPGGDILKRKKPLHLILAMKRDEGFASLMKGDMELKEENIPAMKELIRNCGALDEAKSISRRHGREAQSLISQTEMNDEAKEFFISMIDYVVESLEWYK
jgi:geranylgeranyl diphosphate synthase type II